MLKKTTLLIIVFLITTIGYGQRSVQFLNNNLQTAITMAQSRDKLIFVDTYAPWCIPCKKMEAVFRDPELANYFNKTFVNLRVDMEGAGGKEIHKRYNVAFLPTLMILDSDGNVKYMVDELMTADALLDIAQKIAEPEIYVYQPAEHVSVFNPPTKKEIKPKPVEVITPNPVKEVPVVEVVTEQKSFPKVIPEATPTDQIAQPNIQKRPAEPIIEGTIGEEKILYVLNESDDVPPEILFQESYFRLQLMDGSHKETAKQYLETQKDWATLKNMKFIYDFLYSTETEEFQHFIQNRQNFETQFGVDKVRQTIAILVSRRLETGFPRPTLEESKELFSYLDKSNSEKMALEYHLNNLYLSKHYEEYAAVADDYLNEYDYKDHGIYYRLAYIIAENQGLDQVDTALDFIDKAIELNNINYLYHDTKAYLHFIKDDKKKALSSAQRAKSLASKIGEDTTEIDVLIEMIRELE